MNEAAMNINVQVSLSKDVESHGYTKEWYSCLLKWIYSEFPEESLMWDSPSVCSKYNLIKKNFFGAITGQNLARREELN